MSLISVLSAHLSFGDRPLLDNAELHIEDSERICLLGRNGAGKSTLMRVLTKEQPLDDGKVIYQEGLTVSRLQQDLPCNIDSTVFDFVIDGVQKEVNCIKSFYKMTKVVEKNPSARNINKLDELQEVLDHNNLWLLNVRIHDVLQKLRLEPDSKLSTLSGGWVRKAALARVLVSNSGILFLDEPTNHLDISAILWLESFLKDFEGSIMFISHDRSFIRHVATRIIDLDRGKLFSWRGNYDNYLKNKEWELRVEEKKNIKFDRKLEQEEAWIQSGIQARRVRNERRVRELKYLRKERLQRREVLGVAKMEIANASRSGNVVLDFKNICYHFDKKVLINNFSAQVRYGDRIAFIGPNGCGKTTLLKLILGQLDVDSGNIYRGSRVDIAYFDQYRVALDLNQTVMDNLSCGTQEVVINGCSQHILNYLKDFLFDPDRAIIPAKFLSGGEKKRLLLARLFLKPSNLLILDEPTNDLDIETLKLLEGIIKKYKGTVLLVSHDRQFIGNIVSEYWIFKDYGRIERCLNSFSDIVLDRKQNASLPYLSVNKSSNKAVEPFLKLPRKKSNKISYHLLRELRELPFRLEALEDEIRLLQAQVSAKEFFSQSGITIKSVLKVLEEKELEMKEMFDRWQELELLYSSQ